MVKNFLVAFFLLAGFSVKSQVTVNIKWQDKNTAVASDTIHYDMNKKLTWADFKGTPVASSFAAAITQSGFGYQLSMTSSNGRTIINITVNCYFSKSKSWVKKGMNTDYALLHEQHHFDVTYINACLFIQKLRKANFTRSNCSSLAAQIHDEYFKALSKMQNDYDGETSNGRKPLVQDAWNKKIEAQLQSLITD